MKQVFKVELLIPDEYATLTNVQVTTEQLLNDVITGPAVAYFSYLKSCTNNPSLIQYFDTKLKILDSISITEVKPRKTK